mgnify:CR=1 FL=1
MYVCMCVCMDVCMYVCMYEMQRLLMCFLVLRCYVLETFVFVLLKSAGGVRVKCVNESDLLQRIQSVRV